MARPTKRSGSLIPQLVQRIPADVLPLAAGLRLAIPLGDAGPVFRTVGRGAVDIRLSLRTRDPREAKRRMAEASAYLATVWEALRAPGPVVLSHRQATALSGRLYRAWADGAGRERETAVELPARGGTWRLADTPAGPGDDEAVFGSALRNLTAQLDGADPGDLEPTLGPLVDRLLLAEGIARVDAESRATLLAEFGRALQDGFSRRLREAGGDYRPDPMAERFPEWQPPGETAGLVGHRTTLSRAGGVSLTGLLEDWWREAKATGRKPSTRESYSNSVAAFVAFLGHDDAARVRPEHVVGFKDHRLTAPSKRTGRAPSAKTVKDSDLAALKTVFGWAVANRRLPANPAEGITVRLAKPPKLRPKGFSDEEARAILTAAAAYRPGPGERSWTAAAKRWVPWLCAYTGARVGELAQLRREDIREEGSGEGWTLRITPEAGTVKTNEARDIPLHPHLIDSGFPAFLSTCPSGHLFLRPHPKTGDVLGPLQGLKNRLAEFSRGIVPDPNVAPNHGWRHRFKTVGREAGIDGRVLDAIQGQAPRSVADGYGEVSVRAMRRAIERLPRIGVEGEEG